MQISTPIDLSAILSAISRTLISVPSGFPRQPNSALLFCIVPAHAFTKYNTILNHQFDNNALIMSYR